MSKDNWLRLFSTVVIIAMLVGGTGAYKATAQQPTPTAPNVPLAPGGEGVTADPLSKVDSELRTLAAEGGDTVVQVYILANAGADLSRVATVTERRPFPDGAELVVATVLPSQIEKLASSPDVIAAEAFHPIEAPIPLTPKEDVQRLTPEKAKELRAQAAELKANPDKALEKVFPGVSAAALANKPVAPKDWHGASLIGAPEAWAKGFTGEGVNVAIVDSGVDFGHPDLMDNIAFYEDGPYAGWPIALDPYSMRNLVYNGYDGWDNYWDEDNYSWYAGVYDVLHCTQGQEQSFYFDEDEYIITEDIVALSLSGEIRWSVHPDIQLSDYVYDWMPFILIDANEAGVYDTVIGDLNFDYYFDEFDDTAVLGTEDPVLNQDLGSYVYTDTVVMTGTLYVPYYYWWYPPLWYGWSQTDAITTMPAGTFIYSINHYSGEDATDGADGVADLSGGMVYFIADGVRTIPGMDYLYPTSGTPFNGQLVAFMLGSDYAGGGDHGTLCASAATADGAIKGYFGMFGEFVQYDPENWDQWFNADDVSEYLPWLKAADAGTVQGAAPGANIIALGSNYDVVNGMQGFYDSYTFLAYGVDGMPNSGDEFVEIMSMSYGDGSVHNDGWDWESRLLSYYNENYLPNTTMFASSGNGGNGFGTINSPQGDSVVSVGASTQYGASTVFGSAISLDQINDGEVTPFSGRGPDALGRPDPDVVATGAWGAGDGPLNMNGIYNYSYTGAFPGDGNNAWYEWGGTSRAAPEAAGVMATIYQAYMEANGAFPDYETARQILMSGAQDLSHDVLIQGAGRVNADTGTDIAAGLGGVYVSPSMLAAGEYKGTHYESFANLLFPGDVWSQTFTVHNPAATAASLTLGDEMLMAMETLNYTQVVSPYMGTEGPYPNTYYYWADYFINADPALTDGYPFVRVAHASPDAPAVEVCVDGGVAFQNAPFGAVTGYAPLPPGEHFVEVFPAYSGCAGTAVISATLDLAPFTDYTVVATDFLADITPVVLVDDNSQPEEGNAHVRFFHASPDAPAVDIAVVGGPVLFSDIEFQEVSSYLPVPGDTSYDLEVRLAGTTTVVLTVPGVYLAEGEVYTVYAMGTVAPFTLFAQLTQDTPLPVRPVSHGADLAIPVPEGADFMDVELTVPFEVFDFCYDDPNPDSICYGANQRWSLTVYDWTDRNSDSKLWEDVNGDGVVSVNYGDLVDVSATEQVTQTEINRFTYAYNYANVQGAVVRLGEREDIDNIVIGLVHRNPNNYRDGPEFYQENPLLVKVVFYDKVDWEIVEESAATLSVPAGSSATFDAVFTIPADMPAGLYEGAITVDDGAHLSIIPTTVNVAVPSDELLFTLGGNEPAGTPYDNGRMGSGYTWSGALEEGDWRFYFYDADTGLDQQYLYVRNQWGDMCGNMPTFNETLVWGPNFGDQFSKLEPEKYGPYGNQFAGGTDFANTGDPFGWNNPRVWAGWYNDDGIAQPESRAWATLWDGLNQVQFRNVLNSGKYSCGEGYEATAGVFGVDAPQTGIVINTDQLSGSFNLDAVSPVDGMIAYAAGFGQEEWFRNQDVPQAQNPGGDWPPDLMDAWVHTFDVNNSWGIEAETFGPWSSDVDLYLLYDANNDGVFNIYDNREALAYSRGGSSNEYIWYQGDYSSGYQINPGTYALVMYGYWVEPGAQFDLRLNQYGGDKLNVEGANIDNMYVLSTTPGEMQNLTVNWEVPGNGTWQGMLWFMMTDDEMWYYGMGPGFYIPVTINAGGIVLGGTSKQVDVQQALMSNNASGAVVLTYDITIVNDGTEDIWVQMADLLPEGTTFHEQFVQDPDQPPGDGWWYVAKWWYDSGATEYFWPGDYCQGGPDSVQAANDYYPYLCWNGEVGPSTSGKVHIQYQVKVLPGFAGEITNKADFWADWGESYHEFFSRTATTDILHGVFLPLVSK